MVNTLYDKLRKYETSIKDAQLGLELTVPFLEDKSTFSDKKKYVIGEDELKKFKEDNNNFSKKILYWTMSQYEYNEVFSDAVKGKMSVNESLEELAVVNKGNRLYIPRKKNNTHNRRVEEIGHLIDEPQGLKCRGILYPDNPVTASAYMLSLGIGVTSIQYLSHSSHAIGLESIDTHGTKIISQLFPIIIASLMAPFLGIGVSEARFKSLEENKNQAKYLDEKINMYYK